MTQREWGTESGETAGGDYARSDDDAGNDLSEVLESREKTVTKNEELGTSVGDGNGSDGHQHGRSIGQPSPNRRNDGKRSGRKRKTSAGKREAICDADGDEDLLSGNVNWDKAPADNCGGSATGSKCNRADDEQESNLLERPGN